MVDMIILAITRAMDEDVCKRVSGLDDLCRNYLNNIADTITIIIKASKDVVTVPLYGICLMENNVRFNRGGIVGGGQALPLNGDRPQAVATAVRDVDSCQARELDSSLITCGIIDKSVCSQHGGARLADDRLQQPVHLSCHILYAERLSSHAERVI